MKSISHIGSLTLQAKTIIADSTHILLAQKMQRLQIARTPRTTPCMAQESKPTKTRKRGATPRTTPRRAREKRAAYRAPRWKIPDVTPIGSDAPVCKTLSLAVKRIVETLHPEKIILFGSYAYGNPTPDSDVALLVVMKNRNSHRENYLAVSECLIPRPFAVDIVLRTPQEMTRAMTKGNFFIQEITERGKTLYEQAR